ncbi:carboxypeptidase regulatory-like domain-containing protein [Archangium sp.]|uniref:carboxypeptidase regulatory-like domain-containing protein n=1 Tax=Archangium sp. TaxID=1872627 RepID=UPI00389A4143
MRQTGYSVLTALVLVTSACGGLDNTPFRTGNVRGRLTEADPSVALVSLLGHPEVRAHVAADGGFLLERVPAGPEELFIVASASTAVRLPVVVPPGGSARLEDVQPRAAGFLELKVKAPARQKVPGGQVSVTDTPLQQLPLPEGGLLLVGPLPEGCYTLETSVPGFPPDTTDACVREGESEEVEVELAELDDDSGGHDCSVTGCESGSQCAPDGRCVECLSDEQCATGYACRSERCEGPGKLCAACDGDWKCRTGARCEKLSSGGSACLEPCDSKKACTQGFTCQSGWCVPLPAQFAGCSAYQQVGTACESDASCRERGLAQGLCVEGACTYRCATDAECPEDFACTSSTPGMLCQPWR